MARSIHERDRMRDDGARQRREGGAVLVLFLLLMVGGFGLLGALVDGGRLRVTKQQMDAGVECAALEGVRFKDGEGDSGRRARAIASLARQWDDDLDPGNGDRIGFGAGTLPIVAAANPLGGRLVVTDNPATEGGSIAWKPAFGLQSNAINAAHGDLVAGQFVAGVGAGSGREDDAFRRDDFAPAAPGGGGILADEPGFLVRLRRAGPRLALDRQPGESSAGPPFEWLWARGSAWQEPGTGEGGQSRADGLTLRSTAIASTVRALVVADDPDRDVRVAPFALRADAGAAWTATVVGQPLVLELGGDGVLTTGGDVEQGVVPIAVPRTVAATLEPSSPTADVPLLPGTLIVPVYGTAGAGERRIVGFTLATATRADTTLTIVRLAGGVLPTGASAVSPAALDAIVALSQLPALRALRVAFPEPVLAPVLRR